MKTRPALFFLFLLLPLSLNSCVSFTDKPINALVTASGLEAHTLTDPGLRAFFKINLRQDSSAWPPANWNLTYLMLAAFYYHPDLDVARAELGFAEAGSITAGMRPNPTVSFSPQFDSNALASVSPWTLGWSLNVPIETAGKRGLRLDQAKHQTDAARFKLLNTAWQVRSRVRSAFLAFYVAQTKRYTLQKQAAIQDRLVDLLAHRLSAGAVSQPEVTQSHLTLQQTQLLLAETQREHAEAKVLLASALGLPVQALDGIAFSFDAFSRLPPDKSLGVDRLRRLALINRADILKALAEYDVSQSALQLEIAKQYPDIQMKPGHQWDQGENKWSLGVSLTLPILNQNEGPIAQAEANRKLAAATFLALQNKTMGDIDQTVIGFRMASNKLTIAEALLASRAKQQRAVTAQFNAGETDRLALTSAEAELISIQLARLDTWNRAHQALGLVEDALQRPLNAELDHPSPSNPPRP
ncbi:MAG: TolC family protein [Methylobacter sp.]|nr:TolC family protein [Methylobacter sp.]